jgi:quercetin dioxygenase-like cupin family protein
MITRRRIIAATGFALATAGTAAAQNRRDGRDADGQPATQHEKRDMNIIRGNLQPSRKGPAEYFTGSVRIDTPFKGTEPARVGGAFVTFDPGARTAWHTHPLGQTLIVTAGCGWVQTASGPKEEISPGDVVWIPAGEKHWHGATATIGMTHIAIAEALAGKTVDWMEQVSDQQYGT